MEMVEAIQKAGVVGAGGAGFPDPRKTECEGRVFYRQCSGM